MVRVPAKPDAIEEKFGLDAPLAGEVERFGQMAKKEAEEAATQGELIADGHCELILFQQAEIRKVFHSGEWWFSVIDVIAAITRSSRPTRYWSDLKRQLSEKEGFSELYDNIGQLALPGADGKMYPSEVANTETLLRIIQSVKSPRAEPFKRWLARVGYERIRETQDPEIAIKRAILSYQLQGRSDEWIEKRIRSVVVRKDLTDEWKQRGIKNDEYGILTNVISTATFGGVTVENHKRLKGLKDHHKLRDHMTDLELIFVMLGEKSTTEIARSRDAQGFGQNLGAAKAGGVVAGSARRQLEDETRQPVLSRTNFLGRDRRAADPQQLTMKKR